MGKKTQKITQGTKRVWLNLKETLKKYKIQVITSSLAILVIISIAIGAIIQGGRVENIQVEISPELAKAMTYPEVEEGENAIDGTNNVKFDAFFLRDLDGDGEAESIRGTSKEIGTSDTLYMELNVQKSGYLKDGKIRSGMKSMKCLTRKRGAWMWTALLCAWLSRFPLPLWKCISPRMKSAPMPWESLPWRCPTTRRKRDFGKGICPRKNGAYGTWKPASRFPWIWIGMEPKKPYRLRYPREKKDSISARCRLRGQKEKRYRHLESAATASPPRI